MAPSWRHRPAALKIKNTCFSHRLFFCWVGLLDFLASPGPGVATDRREISRSSIFCKFRPNPSPGRPIRGKNKNSQGQGMFPLPEERDDLEGCARAPPRAGGTGKAMGCALSDPFSAGFPKNPGFSGNFRKFPENPEFSGFSGFFRKFLVSSWFFVVSSCFLRPAGGGNQDETTKKPR